MSSNRRYRFSIPFWSRDGLRPGFQRRHYASDRPPIILTGTRDQFDVNYQRSYETVNVASRHIVSRIPNLWVNSAAYLADGRVLFLRWYPPGARSTQVWDADTDPFTGAFRGSPRLVANPVTGNDQSFIHGMSVTADGSEILVMKSSRQSAVFVGDFSSSIPRITNARRLILDESTNFPHAWTQDSSAVIFESDRNGNFDLFKQEVKKRTPESITATQLTEIWPQTASDGRWILYSARVESAEQTERKLMRIPMSGGTAEEVPIGGWLDEFRCAIGAHQPCVLRTGVRNEYYAFYRLDPIRGKGRELARTKWTPQYVGDWDVSPDCTRVAIPNHETRSARIRVITFGGDSASSIEREVQIEGRSHISGLAWAANGNGWFVSIDTPLGNQMLFVWPDGRSQSLGNIEGWAVLSPDGRRIAFLNRIIATNAWLIKPFNGG